jgi:hypothetical protein
VFMVYLLIAQCGSMRLDAQSRVQSTRASV